MTLNAQGIPFKPGQRLDVSANEDSQVVRVCALDIMGFQQPLAGTQKTSTHPWFHQEVLKTQARVASFFSGLPPSAFHNKCLTTRWDTAQIEHQTGLYPDISAQGSYHIRLHQDKKPDDSQAIGNAKNKASWWVRAASYFSGNHYGFHFPLHDGSEVLIAYANGIAQNPVVIGALTNEVCPSVVTSKNPDEHILATSAGNRLRFVEKKQENLIELSSKDQKNQMVIKEDKTKNILLQSQEGQVHLYTSHTLSLKSGHQFRQFAKGMLRFWVQGELAAVAELGNITFNTEECINLHSEHDTILTASSHLVMQAKQQINLKSHNSMVVKAAKNLSLISHNGRHSWQVPQGNIHIQAEQFIELKTGNSRMLIGSSSLGLMTAGNLIINAASISGV